MRDRIQEAFVDELEKIGVAGLVLKGAATGISKKVAKQGLLKGIIKNPTVRGAASSLGQASMWTLPSLAMQPRPPKERPKPDTGGLR